MNKNKIFLVIILAAAAGIYFWPDLKNMYNRAGSGVVKFDFKKVEVGNLVTAVKERVSIPDPLQAMGTANASKMSAKEIISQTNLQRQGKKLANLTENQKLSEAALAKANDILTSQYFEHVSPSGVGPAELVKQYGYEYAMTGENLILGTSFASEEEMVDSWMNSPGHKANIMNSGYTEIGVAVVRGNYKGDQVWIGVQEFGKPASLCDQPSNSMKVKIEANKNTLEAMSSQIDQLHKEIASLNPQSERYNDLVVGYNKLVENYNELSEQTKSLVLVYNNQVKIFNECVSAK